MLATPITACQADQHIPYLTLQNARTRNLQLAPTPKKRCSLAEGLTDNALQVLMNGRPLGVQFKRNSAYVAQEDCFVPTMSAMETLNFTATLTLPKSVSAKERNDRIEEVLRIMGLYRSRDTQVIHPSTLCILSASAQICYIPDCLWLLWLYAIAGNFAHTMTTGKPAMY